MPFSLRIGHPGGIIDPSIDWRCSEDSVVIERAYVTRTARRVMTGVSYLPEVVRDRPFVPLGQRGSAYATSAPLPRCANARYAEE
jgi:hypothetical protein